jgi:hypothetical protein
VPEYEMTLIGSSGRQEVVLVAEDARDAMWKMLHGIPDGARYVRLDLERVAKQEADS